MHPLYEIAGNFYFLKEHKYVKYASPSMSAVPLQKSYMLQVYICPLIRIPIIILLIFRPKTFFLSNIKV